MFSLFLIAVVATFFADTKQDLPRPRVTLTFGDGSCDPRYGDQVRPLDCQDWLSMYRYVRDGLYYSCPRGPHAGDAVQSKCDMTGGGWTIVLKRFDGSVDFNKTWDQMKHRVGQVYGEHWLGLEDIRRFTTSGDYSMMVEIRDGSRTWTEVYDSFTLSNETEKYTFRAEGFDRANSDNTDSALGQHNYLPFSTRDMENTGLCTSASKGPNWFMGGCNAYIHPFGQYPQSMQWRVNGRDINPNELTWKIKRRET